MRRTISPMRTARIVSGTLAAATLVASLAAQQQPTFRGGVDLMSVDVVVLDKAGMPVTSLAAEDFGVTFAKKPRRVVAAEYVSSSEGIGHGIVLSQRMVRIDHILVYVAWVAILGSTLDGALHGLSRLVAPWAAARRED